MRQFSLSTLLAASAIIALPVVAPAQGGPGTREMERINWMEFREWVPAKINTVLLPIGSLEAHGVTANGTDILAPVAMSRDIAARVNALVAPVVPYGITASLGAYPGGLTVPDEAFRAYVKAVALGLARSKFKNLIFVNGHGGNTGALNALAAEVAGETGVRTLVVNWWTYCSDVTLEVFGEDGGHAGENENAYVMAIDPTLSHQERYTPALAMPNPPAGSWTAFPHPSTIMLYKEGQGYPTFDKAKAALYFQKVNDKVARLIQDVIKRWDAAGM